MGSKVHVAEVYQVKHHLFDNFNGKSDAINRMLAENCPGLVWEGEDVECSERLEVPRAELGDLIAKIASDKEDFEKWAKLYDIEESADQVISIIAKWIALSDQRNDFVVLFWY